MFNSSIRAGYKGNKLLRVDFEAQTHAKVQDMEASYPEMKDSQMFSHSGEIPKALCDLILDAMEHGTEEKTFAPLRIGTEISQEEFYSKPGIERDMIESSYPVIVDVDNDGIEDLIALNYWGGTAGFSSIMLYKSMPSGQYQMTSTFECFIQEFDILRYQGKNYLLMKEFNYATKYDMGYSLYLYEDGKLADGKVFSFAIDDYDMDIVFEDDSLKGMDEIKKTLCNKKLPEILFNNEGVIYGTAETRYTDDMTYFGYSCDIDNDGDEEYYSKSMWYPSNMGTVMSCSYTFENSIILEDLCARLTKETGEGRLYTFWLDKVKGKNILYLYYGEDLDFSLYAFFLQNWTYGLW